MPRQPFSEPSPRIPKDMSTPKELNSYSSTPSGLGVQFATAISSAWRVAGRPSRDGVMLWVKICDRIYETYSYRVIFLLISNWCLTSV